jgi:hypothetical protein
MCFLCKTLNQSAQHAKLQSTPGPKKKRRKKKKENGKKKILKKRKKNEKEGDETWGTEPD